MDESALRSALASLNDCGSSLHRELWAWTFLVALGVVLEIVFVIWEYIEDLHDFRRSIVHPPDRPNLSLFVLGFIGAALVAVGVSGEIHAESKIATLETCIRKGNDALSLLLSREAGDVEKSAKLAHEEADTVKLEADTIQKRLDKALAQLKGVEKDVSIQGPRWKLLDAGKDEFIRELKPFAGAGQKIIIAYCGTLLSTPPEQFRLTMDATELFSGRLGAGWSAEPRGWSSCPPNGPFNFGGNMVLVSTAASDAVKRAATALSDVLNKLEINTSKINEVPPAVVEPNGFIGKVFGSESPWGFAVKDPTSIVLFIGPNSQQAWITPNNPSKH
jgi:hypothetical protein